MKHTRHQKKYLKVYKTTALKSRSPSKSVPKPNETKRHEMKENNDQENFPTGQDDWW